MTMTQDLRAIALIYDGNTAPHISGKTEGELAKQLLAMAEEAGIYIHQDPALMERLACMQEGEAIPPVLYVVIAEILAYSFMLQGKFPEHWRRSDGTAAIEEHV